MDLGNTATCKLISCVYFQQDSCKKINISVISRKTYVIEPQGKLLLKSLNIGINAVFVRVNKDFQTYFAQRLMKNQLAGWWKVISPRSWNFPYLVLNLTLTVKHWIVLAKTGWHKEEIVSGEVRKEVQMGQQGLNINWGCRVTAVR